MKFYNSPIQYSPSASSIRHGNPWGGMQNEIRGGILSFVGEFLVPLAGLGLIVFGLFQIPGCVTEHRNGHGSDFWKKVMIMGGCIIVGLSMTAIWGVLRNSV